MRKWWNWVILLVLIAAIAPVTAWAQSDVHFNNHCNGGILHAPGIYNLYWKDPWGHEGTDDPFSIGAINSFASGLLDYVQAGAQQYGVTDMWLKGSHKPSLWCTKNPRQSNFTAGDSYTWVPVWLVFHFWVFRH